LPGGFRFAADGFLHIVGFWVLLTDLSAPLTDLPEDITGGGKEGDMGKNRSESDDSSLLFCRLFSSLVRFNTLVKAEGTLERRGSGLDARLRAVFLVLFRAI
jgi:hypothetical protein